MVHNTIRQCTLYWDGAQLTRCGSFMDQNMPLLGLLTSYVEILLYFLSFGGDEGYHMPFKTTHLTNVLSLSIIY